MHALLPHGCWRHAPLLGALCAVLLLLLSACGGVASVQTSAVTRVAPYSATSPDWFSKAQKQGMSSHGEYIAAEAIALSQSLYGSQANEYYAGDPALSSVVSYWQQSCKQSDGSLCVEARSGTLQCVEFVSAVFAQIDDQLPMGGNADQFWSLYQGRSGWQEIPVKNVMSTPPALGDMVAWSGSSDGHLAIVVDTKPPTAKSDGYITVAQANAASSLERLAWHANGQIDSWSGYQLQGFIRQQEIAPCLQRHATSEQIGWATLGIESAIHYGIPSKYFLRQLCLSDFSTDGQRQTTGSNGTTSGIAQLSASVAAQIPRCVTNIIANSPDCAQMPGSLPTGTGINPGVASEAIPAAAYEMAQLYRHYLHLPGMQATQDKVTAYEMALVAYHEGETDVDSAVKSCGKAHWLSCQSAAKNRDAAHYLQQVFYT